MTSKFLISILVSFMWLTYFFLSVLHVHLSVFSMFLFILFPLFWYVISTYFLDKSDKMLNTSLKISHEQNIMLKNFADIIVDQKEKLSKEINTLSRKQRIKNDLHTTK